MGIADFLFGSKGKVEMKDKPGAAEYRASVAQRTARMPKTIEEIEGAYSISEPEERMTREQVLGGLGRAQTGASLGTQSMLSKVIGGLRSGYAQNRMALQQRGYLEQLAGTGSQLALQQAALRRGLAQQRIGAKEQAYGQLEAAQQGLMNTQYQQVTQGTSGAIGPILGIAGTILGGPMGGAIGSAIGGAFSGGGGKAPMPTTPYDKFGGGSKPTYGAYAKGGNYPAGVIGLAGEKNPEMFRGNGGNKVIRKPTVFVSSVNGTVTPLTITDKYHKRMLNKGNAKYGKSQGAAGRRPGIAGLGQGYQGWRGQLAR